MKRYQIVAKYNISGKTMECLCDRETASGRWFITYNQEEAEKRVAELNAIGMEARYEELPQGTAWFDDRNWIG